MRNDSYGEKVFRQHMMDVGLPAAVHTDQMARLQVDMAVHCLRVLASALDSVDIPIGDRERVEELVAFGLCPNPADAAERERRMEEMAMMMSTGPTVVQLRVREDRIGLTPPDDAA